MTPERFDQIPSLRSAEKSSAENVHTVIRSIAERAVEARTNKLTGWPSEFANEPLTNYLTTILVRIGEMSGFNWNNVSLLTDNPEMKINGDWKRTTIYTARYHDKEYVFSPPTELRSESGEILAITGRGKLANAFRSSFSLSLEFIQYDVSSEVDLKKAKKTNPLNRSYSTGRKL